VLAPVLIEGGRAVEEHQLTFTNHCRNSVWLGPAFLLAALHATVLDHGSLPMPTLARSIAAGWTGLADPVDADVVIVGAGAVRHH
jgi:hypothetical protein